MNGSPKFRVGLIQMRSGRTPTANMDAAAKLIGEAKMGGAEYVQTPEMTNIMEVSREKLFASILPEENDASLATFRELARKLSIHLHIGSLAVKATVDKAANQSGVRAWMEGWWEVGVTSGDLLAPLLGVRPGSVAMHQNVAVAAGLFLSCLDYPADRNRIVYTTHRQDANRAAGAVDQVNVARQHILDPMFVDRVGVAAAHLHQLE